MREVQDQIKKRREERIRRLMADLSPADRAGRDSDDVRDAAWRDWRKPPTLRQYAAKILLCMMLYGAIWGTFHTGHPALEPAREWVRRVLTEPFRFDLAAEWYHRHIADLPALMPAFGGGGTKPKAAWSAPVAGKVVEPYREALRGVYMVAQPDAEVRSSGEGLVTEVTEWPETGLTVTIRHRAGVETVYGLLQTVRVRENDWLAAGEVIGTVTNEPDGRTGRLFFAVRRSGRFVDPQDVISLD